MADDIKSWVVAGALLRGDIRNFLTRISFLRDDFKFIETKAFIESRFDYKGPPDLVKRVNKALIERYQTE